MAKSNKAFMQSPIVPCKYIYINKPDTAFGGEKYAVTLILNPKDKEQKKFIDGINKAHKEAFDAEIKNITTAKKKYTVKEFKAEEDKDGEETGMLELKLTTKYQPPVFDGEPKKVDPSVTRGLTVGTKVCCKLSLQTSVSTNQKTIGVATYLEAIQIVEPVKGTGGGDNGGFGAVDNGFVADAAENDAPDQGDTEDGAAF